MMSENYFNRLWVLQEIRQARSHACQWGLYSCSIHQLNEACRLIWLGMWRTITLTPPVGRHSRLGQTASDNIQIMSRDPSIFDQQLEFCDADFTVDDQCMSLGCSEPKDHVYGLASLFRGPETYAVDYELDVAEVFARFTIHLLSTRSPQRQITLFLASHAHYSAYRDPDAYARQMHYTWSSRSLPSWCCDFGLRRPGSMVPDDIDSKYFGRPRPGPNSELPASILPLSSKVLLVRGVRCATIAVCSNHGHSSKNHVAFVSKSVRLA